MSWGSELPGCRKTPTLWNVGDAGKETANWLGPTVASSGMTGRVGMKTPNMLGMLQQDFAIATRLFVAVALVRQHIEGLGNCRNHWHRVDT